MKLALTVDLMNLIGSPTSVSTVQNAMNRFQPEAGSYMGCTESSHSKLIEGIESKTFALRFENVTLDLDLITNSYSDEQTIKGFNLKENYA